MGQEEEALWSVIGPKCCLSQHLQMQFSTVSPPAKLTFPGPPDLLFPAPASPNSLRPPRCSEHSSTPLQQEQQQAAGDARLQQQLAGGVYADVEALLSHWQGLDDARKLQYAQMAALTR